MRFLTPIALFILVPVFQSFSQDDLLDMFEEEEKIEYAIANFKTTRVILGQSIENPKKGNLNLQIQHQFGNINDGAYEMFGLDQATIRLGFEYGLTEWLGVGIGRSSHGKTFDGYTKARILRQSKGKRVMPVSVSYFAGVFVNSLKWADPERENFPVSRLSYTHQLLIARKFGSALTIQLSPTLVHRNLVDSRDAQNDVIAIAPGGRFKLSNWVSVNAEYFYLLPGHTADNYINSFNIGVDIETGGHVFQVYLTNSIGIQEPYFVAETTGEWGLGDLHLAFNLNRTFVIKKPKIFKD